jgi:Domain of unknown function (DUF4350)
VTPGSSTAHPALAERWRALGPGWRALAVVAALVFGVNVLLAGVQRVSGGPAPGGEPSSSYATAQDGAAAYADLLARRGHPVQRVRTTLDRARLDPATTVVMLDPVQLEDAESAAVEAFVRSGGRLVVAGQATSPLLRRLVGEGPAWSPQGAERAVPLAPAPEVGDVGTVRAASSGSWSSVGSALPVLADGEQVLAAVAAVDQGRVVLVADAGVFQNRVLGEDDNAAFAVAAVGAPGRPVSFAEAVHGYGDREGLAALPMRWRWVLGGAVVAVLVLMWSRGKRFGPAEETTRALPPPRRAYVDAVAASVAKTRQLDVAVEPLRRAARDRLFRRAGLSPDASPSEVMEAVARLGGPPADVARLLSPVTDDDELVGAGRGAAWVLGEGR